MSRPLIQYSEDFILPHSRNNKLFYASYLKGYRQVCLSGCRSSGKTSNIWPYILENCADWPGFTVLIARKEYSTLVDSTLETLNKHILKYPFYDRRNPWYCDGGPNRPKKFIWDNGSSIRLMGLRDPEQVKGAEPDIFWHNEASRELTLKPWTLVGGSQTAGRGGAWLRYGRPFSQIIADTNPDSPTSWLYKYFHDEKLEKHLKKRRLWLDFKLKDNPAYSDDGLELNQLGEEAYEDLLADHPPGIDRDRYVFGIWCAAEGAVFSGFDFRRHKIQSIPDMSGIQWSHYRGVDFGDDNPFVCTWSSLNRDNGILITHREWRKSHTDIDDHALAVEQHSYEDKYEWTVADSAHPTERRSLKKCGIPTVASKKDTKENIRLMKKRIHNNQYFIFENLLLEKDPRLVRKNKALSILDEIGALKYPEVKNNTPADDLPDKKCEKHAVDTMLYKIGLLDQPQSKKKVRRYRTAQMPG